MQDPLWKPALVHVLLQADFDWHWGWNVGVFIARAGAVGAQAETVLAGRDLSTEQMFETLRSALAGLAGDDGS